LFFNTLRDALFACTPNCTPCPQDLLEIGPYYLLTRQNRPATGVFQSTSEMIQYWRPRRPVSVPTFVRWWSNRRQVLRRSEMTRRAKRRHHARRKPDSSRTLTGEFHCIAANGQEGSKKTSCKEEALPLVKPIFLYRQIFGLQKPLRRHLLPPRPLYSLRQQVRCSH